MPVQIGFRERVQFEARTGVGWEDICYRLQVPRELRSEVRRIVLEMSNEPKRHDDKAASRVTQ